MPLTSELVGREFGRLTVRCDARWLMAYAAGVPDERPELYDTTTDLATHPMFPVAPEWELLITHSSAPAALTRSEALRGVHASHDVQLERAVLPGEAIDIVGSVIGVGRRPAGATQDVLILATAADGATIWRTRLTSLFLGVELDGDPKSIDVGWPTTPLEPAPTESIAEQSSVVRAVDAHVYSECARIWNPIHTDVAIARSAGLAAPILHGTATLARGVSIATALAGWSLSDVRRVSGDFTSMVDLDSTINIRLLDASTTRLRFDVLTSTGRRAISNGQVARSSD
jgi:acyl dehydratase